MTKIAASESVATAVSGSAAVESRKFKLCVFDTKKYQEVVMREINDASYNYDIHYFEEKLSDETVHLAYGFDAVCVFVHDSVSAAISKKLVANNVRLAVYRCAGFDTCDVPAAVESGLSIARVPSYSPNAIAEHAVALMLALNRKIHIAHNRVHFNNFSLDGLTGFNMLNKVVGVIGTGRIGYALIKILEGFGCKVVCFDKYQSQMVKDTTSARYVSTPEEVYAVADIISLHCLLDKSSEHMINESAIAMMKPGVMLINTARGGLIKTDALIAGLRSGHIGSAGLDVVEGEVDYFYEDFSSKVVNNDNIARLLAFNTNVIVTAHQAYLTSEALREIATTTFENCREFIEGKTGKQMTNTMYP